MRFQALRSVVEAAGVAMAPSADQFDGGAEARSVAVSVRAAKSASQPLDAAYSRSWAKPGFRDGFALTQPEPGLIKQWLAGRWPKALAG